MQMGNWALTLGLGAAAGAIGVMMLPKKSTARKMVHRAVDNIEDAAACTANKVRREMDF